MDPRYSQGGAAPDGYNYIYGNYRVTLFGWNADEFECPLCLFPKSFS